MLPCMLRIMVCLLAGELTVEALGLVFPASLCGMLYLLAWLKVTNHVSPDMEATASCLVGNMGLLFVPAGAAIVTFADTLRTDWLAIAIAVVASTSVAIALAGLLARRPQAQAVVAVVSPEGVR